MGWITETLPNGEETTYWLPETLPEPTEDWNNSQAEKYYLKEDQSIIPHPGWYFSNGSFVSDEYLYRNNNWITILDREDIQSIFSNPKLETNLRPRDEWEPINEYTIRKTYNIYQIYQKTLPYERSYNNKIVELITYDHEKKLKIIEYDIIDLEGDELSKKENSLRTHIRLYRDSLLKNTDFYITLSIEKNLKLSDEFIFYRQLLRDIVDLVDLSSLSELQLKELEVVDVVQINNLTVGDIENIFSFFPKIPENIFVEE